MRNACYDWMRRNAAIADTLVFDELRDSDATEPASVGIDPAHLWEQRALRGRVNAAIEALAPPFREVIVLRELEEMSYEQIASVAGIPVGTVMSRLSRARAALRVALQDESVGQHAAAPERKTRS